MIKKRQDRIKQKLDVLKPHYLEIIDESHLHADHTAFGKETHFRIKIGVIFLSDMNLVAKHKIINKLLEDEFKSGLHALSITIQK